ncbi:hypothetical protein TWF694_005500 [Orbilia ellipsospora]|uniref:WSC domain-containing protein n=1 Tax=Orbilia ellipsospora TaxID=2528407 RepID=A0AAV9WUI4_9PEZI
MQYAKLLGAAAFAFAATFRFASALAATDEIQDADTLQSGYLPNHNLSPDIVNDPGFGILWSISTSGGTNEQFFAKPLVYTPPSTNRQVVIAASAQNFVYIIDAINGTIIKSRQLGKPFSQTDVGCGDVQPYIGIMGTPVIDPATDTIYLFSKSYADPSTSGATGVTNGRYRAYALSALDLTDKFGYPLIIDGANADNDPTKYFMGGTHMQRPSLAMVNGVIWAGVASHCDQYNYTGWIIGIDSATPKIVSLFTTISGPSSIAQSTTGSFQSGAGGGGAGIWQSGMGFPSDNSGRFFVVTGNGKAEQDQIEARNGKNPPQTLEECIISLKIDPITRKITPQDFFQPYQYLNLDSADKDLGSAGFTMLDPTHFNATGVTRMGITGGKNGKIYLVNADNLGGYKMGPSSGDKILQTITPPGGSLFGGIGSYPLEGGYIYAASPNYNTVVYGFGKDSNGNPIFTQVGMTAELNAGRVGTGIPTITSMNGQTGTGILWLTDIDNGLRAWNAVPNNDGSMTRLNLPPVTYAGKWQRPAFGNGKVYVAGSNGKITCLGAPINLPLTCTDVNFGDVTIGTAKTMNVSCQANIAINSFKGLNISPGKYFQASNSSVTGTSLAVGKNVTIPVTLNLTTAGFTPGSITSSLQIMTNNGVTGYSSQQPVSLSANLISSNAFLQLQPQEVSFGGVVWNSSQQQDGIASSMYIKNTGTKPLVILNYAYTNTSVDDIDESTMWTYLSAPKSGSYWYINDGFEAAFPNPGSTVAPGVSVAVELEFQPTQIGDFSTWVAVNTSAGYAIVAMSGTSSTAPIAVLGLETEEGGVSNTLSYDFGNVYVGTVLTANIIILNTGGSPLEITKSKPPAEPELYATHPGDDFAEGQLILAGGNATGGVAFAPFVTTLVNTEPEFYTAAWTLNTDGENFGGPYSVNFTGTIITQQVGPLYQNGSAIYKYLGCFADGTNGTRIAPNKWAYQGRNQNGLCQTTCFNNGYAFALTEYVYECWCGNSVPLPSLKNDDSKCNTPCAGAVNQTCGGTNGYASSWYNSQRYNPTTNLLDGIYARPPGFQQTAGNYTFYGCWSDSTSNRSLKGKSTTSSTNMNITYCANYCSGYQYMATSYGDECYCGNSLGGISEPLTDCNMLCAADQYSYCGAGSRLSLYLAPGATIPNVTATTSTTSTATTTSGTSISSGSTTSTTSGGTPSSTALINLASYNGFTYLSCWTDQTTNRTLAGWGLAPSSSMTIEQCINYCAPNNQYVGMEYGQECWCGPTIMRGTAAPATDCNMPCSGNSIENCGGTARLALYNRTSIVTVQSTTSSSKLTAQSTIATSTSTTQTTTSKTTSSTPTGPTIVPSRGNFTFLSCWTDATDNRTLAGWGLDPSANMTVESCIDFCAPTFQYIGLEDSRECWCGNSLQSGNATAVSDCSEACTGASTENCGGPSRLLVYHKIPYDPSTTTSTATTTSSTTTSSKIAGSPTPTIVHNPGNANYTRFGCVNEPTGGRAMPNGWVLSGTSSTMGVEKCLEYCNGKTWVGLEYGGQCWCSSTPVGFGADAPDSDCNMACGGNSSEYCGAGSKFDLYVWRASLASGTIVLPSSTSVITTQTSSATVSTTGTSLSITTTKASTTVSSTLVSSLTTTTSTSTTKLSSLTLTTSSTTSSPTVTTTRTLTPTTPVTIPTTAISSTSSTTKSQTTATSTATTTTSSSSSKTTSSTSSSPVPSVAAAGTNWNYIGCVLDSVGSRTLPNKTTTTSTMSVEYCSSFCMGKYNLPYAGLENANQCFCSDSIGYGRLPGQTGCTYPCSGNTTEICGGPSRLSVYKNTKWKPTVIPPAVLNWKYNGCWTEITGRAIRGYSFSNVANMTTTSCVSTCIGKGYTVAGLENAQECYCGNTNLATVLAPDNNCNMNCVGNSTEFCGAGSRLQVYFES